jgi:hypothetical protein
MAKAPEDIAARVLDGASPVELETLETTSSESRDSMVSRMSGDMTSPFLAVVPACLRWSCLDEELLAASDG